MSGEGLGKDWGRTKVLNKHFLLQIHFVAFNYSELMPAIFMKLPLPIRKKWPRNKYRELLASGTKHLFHELSPPQRLQLGIPINSNNRKNGMRAGDDGKREKASLLSPLPIVPRALSFHFSPASPVASPVASPQHKEASVEEKVPRVRVGYEVID